MPFADIYTGQEGKKDHLYLNFIQSRTRIRINVITFAAMIGIEPVQTPKRIQSRTPKAKRRSIVSERSRVSLSFHARITCGTKDRVVRAPAIYPTIIMVSMGSLSILCILQ
jgi:hypothetical protein